MVCEKWIFRFLVKGEMDRAEFIKWLKRNFPRSKLLRIILEKLELLYKDPFKYTREKLGKDKYGNPMFSIEVTGDIRILYSVDSKNCIVFIWGIGSHKKVYGS
ncbi:type II toxin-antitoxin system RelE family toxin [Sulfurisphaera ohwakuensis]|uniref:Type II toxin-antitoxin system RelE/ParE family toxin n=1 Tax=Sulfurisphaera ohwakuensis TaxID=69656 RepID=A0A650CHV6_SULOH|nr:type II toxin-antitoxin system RelE/ParE family toxin [Sulfurisphaera ohwakuensis]MBB5253543.1 mRNA-degrading endonuclease RelE of RelBE toxin-antitoxin system [Sulfurisphaera ohwakuensis]QGR17434.1 type II toxin-antitoxin system RelE/ParE family toxin [Sulfurisphaera ohwakuensis]